MRKIIFVYLFWHPVFDVYGLAVNYNESRNRLHSTLL